MFGWLIKSEVNDDAVRLKDLVDSVFSKFVPLDNDELCAKIRSEFSDEMHGIDDKSGPDLEAVFVFSQARYFQFFLIRRGISSNSDTNIVVQGRGKYAGYSLFANDPSARNWHSSIQDGIGYAATGGARKLIKMMQSKFDVEDLTDLYRA